MLRDIYECQKTTINYKLPERTKRWLLTYLFSSSPYWLEDESEAAVFDQLIATMRALTLGIDVREMDKHLFVALSLHNGIRTCIQQVEKTVYLENFRLPGIGQIMVMARSTHEELTKRYRGKDFEASEAIFRGGIVVTGMTLLALADAFDEFDKELSTEVRRRVMVGS